MAALGRHRFPAAEVYQRVEEYVNTPISQVDLQVFQDALCKEKQIAATIDVDVKDAKRRIRSVQPKAKKTKKQADDDDDMDDEDDLDDEWEWIFVLLFCQTAISNKYDFVVMSNCTVKFQVVCLHSWLATNGMPVHGSEEMKKTPSWISYLLFCFAIQKIEWIHQFWHHCIFLMWCKPSHCCTFSACYGFVLVYIPNWAELQVNWYKSECDLWGLIHS